MAIKKSDLYSSLWASCDALRGGMDASQYKDYVLVLLFIKYVSDKYAGVPFAPIAVPAGASFADMAALKGKADIGDRINKQIIAPLFNANRLPLAYAPDFNEAAKLGSGRELVDRLTELIAIFQNPALDFSRNRAGDDDLMGDAYEYLMRHFATESGKSKGQFYTPAEVSRVIAAVIGIAEAETTSQTTVSDPTCGSGSLLLKVADAARAKVSLFGQEKDSSTAGLARMNMILHDNAAAEIEQGNTLANPKYLDGGRLRAFDYVVANPPFSDKRWATGLDPARDAYQRFDGIGVPPGKQGDYAYLLHILKSMKSTAAGACVLPHGVLFRGNVEGEIRQNLIRRGVIKGIIGLPANLFYGTGIPACIVVLDKREAAARRGIFMLDASAGFLKDGPKNRLRARDIHRIVSTFRALADVPHYARMVPLAEIEKNGWNLNLPRYLDTRPPEDQQDIEAHLKGGIPAADVDALTEYWQVCPGLRAALFSARADSASDSPLTAGEGGAQRRVGVRYFDLIPDLAAIKPTIQQHPEFQRFIAASRAHWTAWQTRTAPRLKALAPGFYPRDLIHTLSEDLLAHYRGRPLVDAYAVYQHLMDYWDETLRDDADLIAADGWQARPQRIIESDKKGREKDKGWACDLVPKALVVAHYFREQQAALDALAGELETAEAALAELEEENAGDDAAFSGFDKVNARAVKDRLDEIAESPEDADADEVAVLKKWQKLDKRRAALKKRIKEADAALDAGAYAKYAELTDSDIQALVVDDKWLAELARRVGNETERAGQQLTRRVKELAERYAAPLPQLETRVAELQAKVDAHLKRMGFAWT